MSTATRRAAGSRVGAGHVTLYPPTAHHPYYRLVFTDRDGRRAQRSAGRDPVEALQRAKRLDDDLSRQHGQAGHRTLGDLVAEYVATPRGRLRTPGGRLAAGDWQPTHHDNVARTLRRAVQGLDATQAWDLDRDLIDQMRTACGTLAGVRQMTSIVRNFLRWCEEQGALSAEQVPLLPAANAPDRAARQPQAEPRPARQPRAREQGQARGHTREEDCPSRADVLALAAALQRRVPWGELAVHVAVGLGLREGEQFQLTADDLEHRPDGMLHVKITRQWSTRANRRADPKHRKTRTVPVRPYTRDGYPLERKLLERAEQARAEKAAADRDRAARAASGRPDRGQPEALLFPAPAGGMWWSSALTTKLLVPAMKDAGWAFDTVHELRRPRNGGPRKLVTVTQMRRTWHSLRHRFARDMIDYFHMPPGPLMAIGGWENLGTVHATYYHSGAEHLEQAERYLLAPDAPPPTPPTPATAVTGSPGGAAPATTAYPPPRPAAPAPVAGGRAGARADGRTTNRGPAPSRTGPAAATTPVAPTAALRPGSGTPASETLPPTIRARFDRLRALRTPDPHNPGPAAAHQTARPSVPPSGRTTVGAVPVPVGFPRRPRGATILDQFRGHGG
ncbi:Phage integrase family protein [Cellulosimicrobium cellulans]|nr:Phage integrase family protein [Cellulosimicrobium cellulans]